MTSYRQGYAFEQRVRKHLEIQDYYVVRSAGSRGLADLVAFSTSHGDVKFIACRTDRARYSAKEANALWHLAKRQQALGVPAHAWLAYRAPGPGTRYDLYLEQIDFEVWLPAEDDLPPWYEEEK